MKQGENIKTIGTFRSCGKPQQKLWCKVIDNFFIAVGIGMMNFIYNDVIELIFFEAEAQS